MRPLLTAASPAKHNWPKPSHGASFSPACSARRSGLKGWMSLDSLVHLTLSETERKEFGARIFKVTHTNSGERLTWLKVTGGELKVKDELVSRDDARVSWRAKADQLRLYSGAKFKLISSAPQGTVCAVTGLDESAPG